MSAQIGDYYVNQMSGQIPGWKNDIQTRERAGTDGYTYVLLGKRSAPFELQTVELVSNLAEARQRRTDYETLCGTFVPLETSEGDSYTAVLVLDVDCVIAPLLKSTDGSYALIRATWKLQRTQ